MITIDRIGESRGVAACRVPMAPDPDLAPNRFRKLSGWRRQEVVSTMRRVAELAAFPAAPPAPLAVPFALDVTIAWGTRRNRQDFDGAVGSVKALVDGLMDAGWATDDALLVAMRVTQHRDPDGEGYVDVVMTPEPVADPDGGLRRDEGAGETVVTIAAPAP